MCWDVPLIQTVLNRDYKYPPPIRIPGIRGNISRHVGFYGVCRVCGV